MSFEKGSPSGRRGLSTRAAITVADSPVTLNVLSDKYRTVDVSGGDTTINLPDPINADTAPYVFPCINPGGNDVIFVNTLTTNSVAVTLAADSILNAYPCSNGEWLISDELGGTVAVI